MRRNRAKSSAKDSTKQGPAREQRGGHLLKEVGAFAESAVVHVQAGHVVQGVADREVQRAMRSKGKDE